MAASIDDLTVSWEEDGVQKVRELARRVLSDGTWATIVFRFAERNSDGTWRAPKVQIRRYQKRRSGYVFHSKFIVPSDEQGLSLGQALIEWCDLSRDEAVDGDLKSEDEATTSRGRSED